MFRLFFLIVLFLSSYATCEVYGQYRDPFAAKSKRKKIKSNNKKGLFVRKGRGKKLKKGRDPFASIPTQKGAIGIFDDPFESQGRVKYKPTGVDKKSYKPRHRRGSFYKKYDVNNIRTRNARHSQKNYIRIRYR